MKYFPFDPSPPPHANVGPGCLYILVVMTFWVWVAVLVIYGAKWLFNV